jgi:Cu/Ag efflux pump CusA
MAILPRSKVASMAPGPKPKKSISQFGGTARHTGAIQFAMFGNVKDGLLVVSGIPFILTYGIVSSWLRSISISISAAVRFIALSGVAVLNGLVTITFIRELREQGRTLDEAIHEGALDSP